MEKLTFFESRLLRNANVEIIAKDRYGKMLWVRKHKNLVVTGGRMAIARMLAEGISNPISHYAWGDGGHDPNVPANYIPVESGNVALEHEIFRKVVFLVQYPEPAVVKFIGIIEPTEIVGNAISEMGLFMQDGTMFARVTYSLMYKGPVQLEFRWSIHI